MGPRNEKTHMPTYDLVRFKEAQRHDYAIALAEIRAGRKRSHWIWYVFPQVQGLGYSSMCQIYGIHGLGEAAAYLADATLSTRLVEISQALLDQPCRDAREVLGPIDAMKARSSMTLFALVDGADPVFCKVLDAFYDGRPDERTLEILGATWPVR